MTCDVRESGAEAGFLAPPRKPPYHALSCIERPGKMAAGSTVVKIDRLLCIASAARPAGVDASARLKQDLDEAGYTILEERDPGAVAGADAILLLGGDGFLMETLHRLEFPGTPIFGVNFGTVGFLMNSHTILPELPRILRDGRFREVTYSILQANAVLEDGHAHIAYAFNEFVLERQTGQAVRLQVSIDGIAFNRFAGDGFVISTPAGSTAYNLAAGGPAVHPQVKGFVLTPLYPHRAEPFHSMQFSLMLPQDSRISVESEDLPKRHMRLVVDGRPIKGVACVEILDSQKRVTLLRTPDRDFVRMLSQKFIGWEGDDQER